MTTGKCLLLSFGVVLKPLASWGCKKKKLIVDVVVESWWKHEMHCRKGAPRSRASHFCFGTNYSLHYLRIFNVHWHRTVQGHVLRSASIETHPAMAAEFWWRRNTDVPCDLSARQKSPSSQVIPKPSTVAPLSLFFASAFLLSVATLLKSELKCPRSKTVTAPFISSKLVFFCHSAVEVSTRKILCLSSSQNQFLAAEYEQIND